MTERQAAWETWFRSDAANALNTNPNLAARLGFFAGYDAGGDEAIALLRRARDLVECEWAEEADDHFPGLCDTCVLLVEIDAYLEGTNGS